MAMQVLDFAQSEVDPREFRNALGRFATGVTVITTRTPAGKCEGMTANSFSALSLDPPLVLWSVKRDAPSLPSFQEAGVFAISVLTQEQADLSHHFATRQRDKFADITVPDGQNGCPLLQDSLAFFECRLRQTVEAGDHMIMIGEVTRAGYDERADPLLFSAGRYAIAAALPNRDARDDLASMWDGLG